MTLNLVGKTLGQYQLVEIVGQGSLATVYKAYQPSLERWVAVKVLHSRDQKLLARFEREAKAAAQLRHPNILVIHEYGEEAGWPYIAMQLVEGGTLANYLTGQPINWDKVITLCLPIAQALHYAHQQGLIHRDVKPSNILMPQPDWPLLTDFGLVKIPNPDEMLTDSDICIGTPAYIPPEQAGAQTIDHRADMYSLGVVMFQLVAGRLPFEYNNVIEMINAHMLEPAPRIQPFNPKCHPELETIILTALQKSADKRYPDLEIMINALTRVLRGSTRPLDDTAPLSVAFQKPLEVDMPAAALSGQEVKILLTEEHVPLNIPDPGDQGLIIGRSGRQAQVDIDLSDYGALETGVSRQHARLIRQGTEWLIEDLASMNGTYVNKKRIAAGELTRLQNGDVIRCSTLSFIFLISPKA
jgi:serine/threonine protein kinase